MSTETDLTMDAVRRDIVRYREAEQGDRQRIMGRMIDTIMEAYDVDRNRAVDMIAVLMQEG